MPNYNQTLQTNNSSLEEIITQLNNMPDAGSSTLPNLQEKTVTPSTSLQSVTPDSGYDGLSKVTVNAMPTATQAAPSITVSSAGLITASATQSAGYVASGTKSATKQLTTQAAKTITPSTSSQTAVASGRYTTGAVTVSAIPSTYVKPSATKAAATITPNTADQTIAAGTYCSGAQTIKGDSNLVAGNIKSGVSIFGVSGSYGGSGDSGGGGSLGTCTIEIDVSNHSGNKISKIWLHKLSNGQLTFIQELTDFSRTKTIENVVCGTAVYVETSYSMLDAECTKNFDNLGQVRCASNKEILLIAPTTPNSVGRFYLTKPENDGPPEL